MKHETWSPKKSLQDFEEISWSKPQTALNMDLKNEVEQYDSDTDMLEISSQIKIPKTIGWRLPYFWGV